MCPDRVIYEVLRRVEMDRVWLRKAAASRRTPKAPGLESGATLRARADVDADDRFAVVLHGVEAVVAKRQGQLVFAFGVETAVTLRTSRKRRTVAQFANVNFWMNFKRDHENSPGSVGARAMPETRRRSESSNEVAASDQRCTRTLSIPCAICPKASTRTCGNTPWPIERTPRGGH